MDKKEFEKQKQVLKDTYEKELVNLQKQYARLNNSVKIGDIIQDWRGTLIKVDKMQIITSSFTNEYPEYIYEGLKVTKKGILFKDGTSDDIYQSDLKKINGVEVKNEN